MNSKNGDVLREGAVTAMGIVSLPDFIMAGDLAAGRLQRVLPGYSTRPLPLSEFRPSLQFILSNFQVLTDCLAQRRR